MSGILNRGNLILGVAWALAIGVFLNRAGKIDAHAGGSKAPRTRAAQVTVSTPAAAADASAVDEAPVAVPVSTEPVGDALSRNDSARRLP